MKPSVNRSGDGHKSTRRAHDAAPNSPRELVPAQEWRWVGKSYDHTAHSRSIAARCRCRHHRFARRIEAAAVAQENPRRKPLLYVFPPLTSTYLMQRNMSEINLVTSDSWHPESITSSRVDCA